MIHQIRLFMERNKYLEKLVAPIQKTKIMTKRRENSTFCQTKEKAAEFTAFYEAHKDSFEKVFQMLEDDFSRKTLQTLVDYRLDPLGGY